MRASVCLAGGAFGAAGLPFARTGGGCGAAQPAPKERRGALGRVAWSDLAPVRAGEMRFTKCAADMQNGGGRAD